ncbi:DUF4105 domain-containing protein [uncultured Bacteroides sp.]|uniref:lipoprotein N-acyltransferase Lnb n=1 Tax=uncultured Bacteroides sp. TaxID=162156 RepID=UPI002599E1A3|nr:DUF4105 domain-containing protein [uncultured Bacteroides sp.]
MVQKQAVPPATEDSIRFSLLTCGAGEEIYSLFGHTAIRYENFTRSIDAVFNYGIFSFNTPNFILRFTLGETDYQLGVTSYKQFAYEYTWTGRDVWQQTLNLNAEEKKKLLALLEENYLPQNRIYRYNFFYDNCATRPRDQIERAVQGTLEYADDMTSFQTGISFRDIVHQYTIGHSWARFGIDLCLGSQADKDITRRQMMFAPFYLKDFLAKAQLKNAQGMERPLVSSEDHIIQSPQQTSTEETPSPLQTAFLLFTIVTIATAYGIYRRKSLWLLDLLLFLAAGVAGCILAFLASFSQHPAVSPNYLLFLFHPLHLLCLPWMIKRIRKKEKSIYMWANIIVLTFFILLWGIIPQEFNLAVLPLALSLWIRSASNLYLTYIRK